MFSVKSRFAGVCGVLRENCGLLRVICGENSVNSKVGFAVKSNFVSTVHLRVCGFAGLRVNLRVRL